MEVELKVVDPLSLGLGEMGIVILKSASRGSVSFTTLMF